MLFSSISFLYYFLTCVLIIYAIVPKQWKNGALLLASLVFYAWGEPKYVFLMIAMVVSDYFLGLLIGAYNDTRKGSLIFAGSIAWNVAVLAFFKFSDTAWPIGISFYTFQLISYLADVRRKKAEVQKNLVSLGAYVTMFPQLIAGPIVRYTDIEQQLRHRTYSYEKILCGIRRFSVGLAKKILISNALGELVEIFRASGEKSVLFFWVYAVSYTLQIYFDFSGYSDMAIGLGHMFGFTFSENFNYPYISRSITEFWRRWHISLGSWFRDYVYIPLGGNRVSKPRWYLNIFIVWLLTGLWHGAAWNFVLWGLMFAVLLVIEKRGLLQRLEKGRIWNHCYVLLFVIVSFVIFNAANIGEAFVYLKSMFGFGNVPFVSAECIYYLQSFSVLIIAAIIGSTPAVRKIGRKLPSFVRTAGAFVLLMLCTAWLVDSSFNPFLYFRF